MACCKKNIPQENQTNCSLNQTYFIILILFILLAIIIGGII